MCSREEVGWKYTHEGNEDKGDDDDDNDNNAYLR